MTRKLQLNLQELREAEEEKLKAEENLRKSTQVESLRRKEVEDEEEVEELLRFDDGEEDKFYSSTDDLDKLVAQSVARFFSRAQNQKLGKL
jgi:predicted Zn-dependent protease